MSEAVQATLSPLSPQHRADTLKLSNQAAAKRALDGMLIGDRAATYAKLLLMGSDAERKSISSRMTAEEWTWTVAACQALSAALSVDTTASCPPSYRLCTWGLLLICSLTFATVCHFVTDVCPPGPFTGRCRHCAR
jgi:hypothetical protein